LVCQIPETDRKSGMTSFNSTIYCEPAIVFNFAVTSATCGGNLCVAETAPRRIRTIPTIRSFAFKRDHSIHHPQRSQAPYFTILGGRGLRRPGRWRGRPQLIAGQPRRSPAGGSPPRLSPPCAPPWGPRRRGDGPTARRRRRRRRSEEGGGTKRRRRMGAMRVGRGIPGIIVGIFLVREEDSQRKGRGPSHRFRPAAFLLA